MEAAAIDRLAAMAQQRLGLVSEQLDDVVDSPLSHNGHRWLPSCRLLESLTGY